MDMVLCCCQLTYYGNGVQSMCKYCDADSLKKMHDEVDAILSGDYYDGIEDRLNDTLDGYSVFTLGGWEGNVFYFLDNTYWDEDSFAKWYAPFEYCPMCGRKLID